MLHRPTACLWLCPLAFLLLFGARNLRATDPIQISSDDLHISGSPTWQYRTPAMLGDFYFGTRPQLSTTNQIDRLFVLANDLDVPLNLGSTAAPLALSEPGPIGVYHSGSLTSVQDLQAILRGGPIGVATLAGTINENAVLLTSNSIATIQNQLAGTADAYDIIAIAPPPGSYNSAVLAIFMTRNGVPGEAVFDANASGAIEQSGNDTLVGGEDMDALYFFDYQVFVDTQLADATSGGVGRMKIAEGGTVLPQDRIYCRYSYIDAVRYADGVGLSRFVPGMERSFLDGLFSLEVRLPIAAHTSGTETVYSQGSFSSDGQSRFGNMSLYSKTLLLASDRMAFSGGLGVILPTASDLEVNDGNGVPLVLVSNESVRLQPFLAGLCTPTKDWFVQGFVQFDGAANGNTVSINSNGSGLQQAGRLTDSNNLFFDLGLGTWLYRSSRSTGVTGVIPMLEVHQNLSLQSGDKVSAGSYRIGDLSGTHSLTSLVAGTTFELNRRSNLSLAYVTAMGGGDDQQYNGGLQVFFSTGF